MDAKDHFRQYVDSVGGASTASQRLKITESMVYHMLRGTRGISPDLALKIEQDSHGQIRKENLVWGSAA